MFDIFNGKLGPIEEIRRLKCVTFVLGMVFIFVMITMPNIRALVKEQFNSIGQTNTVYASTYSVNAKIISINESVVNDKTVYTYSLAYKDGDKEIKSNYITDNSHIGNIGDYVDATVSNKYNIVGINYVVRN